MLRRMVTTTGLWLLCIVSSTCGSATRSPTSPDVVQTQPPRPNLTFTLSGVVRDRFGVPIQAAQIRCCERTTNAVAASTDSNGRYVLAGLSGPITVVIEAWGFASMELPLDVSADDRTQDVMLQSNVEIKPGNPLALEIRVGENAYGTIAWDDNFRTCSDLGPVQTLRGPCQVVRVDIPEPGTLHATVEWSGGAQIGFAVFDDWSWPGTLATKCCQSGEAFDVRTSGAAWIHVHLQAPSPGVVQSFIVRTGFTRD